MKRVIHSKNKAASDDASAPVRKPLLLGAIVFAVIVIGAIWMIGRSGPATQVVGKNGATKIVAIKDVSKRSAIPSSLVDRAPSPQTVVIQPAAPAVPAQQLVDELAKISDSKKEITPEQAARFKQNITNLVNQGPASVPAIEGFLKKNLNSDFGEISGGDQVGYSSLRSGLIDALNQIGGPEAEAAMVGTLQTTATPSEILELSKDLEQQAPGQYRDQILAAANDAVKMAAQDQLGKNVEVGPAYHIIDAYHNAENPGNVAVGETDAH
jgi:hypothetical protein